MKTWTERTSQHGRWGAAEYRPDCRPTAHGDGAFCELCAMHESPDGKAGRLRSIIWDDCSSAVSAMGRDAKMDESCL